jgi:hypothetical protein
VRLTARERMVVSFSRVFVNCKHELCEEKKCMWCKKRVRFIRKRRRRPVTVVMGREGSVLSRRGKECVWSISPMRSRRHVQEGQYVTSEGRLSAQTHPQTENTNGDANGVMYQGRRSDGVKVDDARPPLYIFTCS